MATDYQSLLSSQNVVCFINMAPGIQRALMLALLQTIAQELNPSVATDYQSLLSQPNVACYINMAPGIQNALMLALLQDIAGNIGPGGSSTPDGLSYAGPPTFTPTQTNGLPYIVVDSTGRQFQYFNGGWN